MWKGKYYEELRDAARAGEILSTLSDDLLSMQAPTLVEIRNGVANVIANASNIRTYAEKAN